MSIPVQQLNTTKKESRGLIDCDVHPYLSSLEELIPYCDESLQRRLNIGKFEKSLLKDMNAGAFDFPKSRYNNPNHVLRTDAITASGGVPGSDVKFLTTDLFDRFNTTYGVLNIGHGSMSAYHNVELAAEYNSACNDWLYDNWVNNDQRFKMTMAVTPLDPELTMKEIARIGGRQNIVGINLQNVNIPLGKRHFWPIYEIAEEYGLPIILHPDAEGSGEYAPTQSVGPASTYIEWHTTLSLVAQRQIMSLVFDGIFEKFPKLVFVFIEYGVSWLPSIMWRMDKNWKALREEVPWVQMLPSEYIRRNVRLGTQPIEEPFRSPLDLVELIQMVNAEDMLLFCSDYPHWDGDISNRILSRFPEPLKDKIFYENAKRLFQL